MGHMETEFNLQEFLKEMDRRQQEDHKSLSQKLDTVVAAHAEHETRLVVIEKTHAAVKYLVGAAVVAAFGSLSESVRKWVGL